MRKLGIQVPTTSRKQQLHDERHAASRFGTRAVSIDADEQVVIAHNWDELRLADVEPVVGIVRTTRRLPKGAAPHQAVAQERDRRLLRQFPRRQPRLRWSWRATRSIGAELIVRLALMRYESRATCTGQPRALQHPSCQSASRTALVRRRPRSGAKPKVSAG